LGREQNRLVAKTMCKRPKQPHHRTARKHKALDGVDIGQLPPGWYCDGAGLWLRVRKIKNVSRRWCFLSILDGRRHEIALGGWPSLSLCRARRTATNLRNLLFEARDPWLYRGPGRVAVRSFREVGL
jgi:hypothetical protein